MHANLTDEQYSAVIDDSKPIVFTACAGSGKSKDSHNINNLFNIERCEAPEEYYCSTFTTRQESIKRRGEAEALHKFGLSSENIVGAMFIGTLDAFVRNFWEGY